MARSLLPHVRRSLAGDVARSLRTVSASRAIRPVRPDRLARVALAQRRFGLSPAFAVRAGAELDGRRPAIHDEDGTVTFAELDARGRALAAALHGRLGVRAGQRVAIMCRNHRGFVEAAVAVSRLGCDLVLLNTDFAGPQLADVLAREEATVAIHDEEFAARFDAAGFAGTRIVADGEAGGHTLAGLIAGAGEDAPVPSRPGRAVLMTSGTTGTPKGVTRHVDPRALLPALVPAALGGFLALGRIHPTPRRGDPVVVTPPLFHMYGYYALLGAFAYGSPVVLSRRFDPELTLAAVERHRAGVLLLVPTMLKRIMDLPAATRARYDTSSLRMVPCGAAPLPAEAALAFMDAFGDLLYNAYASTEVGAGTLATPADLRAAPGTVGRASPGVSIRILDEEGRDMPAGESGRIFVGSALLFDGYSDGTTKDVVDGRMRTGDVGHLDADGRLFIDGRDDDMILSGGENVFPQEVEDLLLGHPAVADAAVTGVADEDFGQRLAAFVVLKPDARLSADEVREHVAARLARYKVPRDVRFVEALPRTSTGKLQRRRLDA